MRFHARHLAGASLQGLVLLVHAPDLSLVCILNLPGLGGGASVVVALSVLCVLSTPAAV